LESIPEECNEEIIMREILYINILFHFTFKETDILKNTLLKFIFKETIEELYNKFKRNTKHKQMDLLKLSLTTFMLDQIIDKTIKKINLVCIAHAKISQFLHQYCTEKYIKNYLEPGKTSLNNFIKNTIQKHEKCKDEILDLVLAIESSLTDLLPFFVTNQRDIEKCIYNFISDINHIINNQNIQ
jgi:hypothetical protein